MAARIINAASGSYQGIYIVEFDIARASGETDTGFDFKSGDVIMSAWIDVQTAEATASTKTIDVGLLSSESGGDADGILDGIVTSATGTIVGKATVTTGSNTKFFASTTRGVLLQDFQAGTDVDQDEGVACSKEHAISTTAVSLTYTLGDAATELVAKGYVQFFRPISNMT
jgi:hypothetical protein